MERLPRLQSRIASLGELRELIRALRALAASHVQEAQGTLSGIRQYVEVVEDAIGQGAALLRETSGPSMAPLAAASEALIVVCSEHGFVGGLNERLLDHAAAERRDGRQLLVVGRRGAALAAEKGLAVAHSFPMATHVGGVLGVTRSVADYLTAVPAAEVVFASHRRGGDFEVESRHVLPLDPALLAGARRRSPPLHHLAPELLLQRLAGEYLLAEITRAVMEALASENAARLRIMEMADRNIKDKLQELKLQAHNLRQEAITSEMLDVVTGSEAILGGVAR